MNSKWNDSFQVPSLSRLRYPKETSSLGTGTRHPDECLFGHFLGLFPPQATISLSLPREQLQRRVIRRLEVRLGGIGAAHIQVKLYLGCRLEDGFRFDSILWFL